MTSRLRAFIVAGEPSGDQLGGQLMTDLKALSPEIEFQGIGGDTMVNQGLAPLFPMSELSVMGLTEVLPKLPTLLRRIRETADAAIAFKPDVLITIDSPDFCLRVAKRVKAAQAVPCVHYVAPSVWAWRPKRADKMAKTVDHVLALLPFEPSYMQAAGMSCDFVGHPVSKQPIISQAGALEFRDQHDIPGDVPQLCVLPGSRRGEVERHGEIFLETITKLKSEIKDLNVVIPAATHVTDQVKSVFADSGRVLDFRGLDVPSALHMKLAAFAASDAALAASGTVSLELARQSTPMVIGYKMSATSQFLVRRLFQANSATLVNLVSDSLAVPEYFFDECTAENLTEPLANLLRGQSGEQDQAMQTTIERLETEDAAAARSVLNFLGRP